MKPEEKKKVPDTILEEESLEEKEVIDSGMDSGDLEDLDEELLVENDGDFFWLLQRVIWTLVKIIVGFGAVFLIIWIIWDTDTPQQDIIEIPLIEDGTEEVQIKEPAKEVPKETKPLEGIKTPKGSTQSFQTKISHQEEVILKDDVGIYLHWAGRSKSFFETRMNTSQWGTSLEVRTQKMNHFLQDLYNLILESSELRQRLVQKINGYYAGIEQNTTMIDYETARLNEALELVRLDEVDMHLYKKIALQKQREQNKVFFDTNKYVLQVMEMYDRALRDVYQKARANQRAIIHNIQVVQFVNDPFKRVLTPAEWQSR